MPQTEEKIIAMLEEISRLPDMIGLCIYIDQQGICFPNLPTWCPEAEMERTGRLVLDLFSKNSIFNRRQKNITITFESVLIIAVRLNDYASLICLSLSTIDTDFFETASHDVIEVLKREIPLITVSMKLKDSSAEDEFFVEQLNRDKVILSQVNDKKEKISLPEKESGELTIKVLLPVERALTKVIGPASEIIMTDTVKTWKEGGEPSVSRMNELVDLLCKRIGTSQQVDKFREILQNWIPNKTSSTLKIKVIEKALARMMGPASSIVIEELLTKWQPDDLSSSDQLNELVDLLCIEIDDPEREKKFRTMVTNGQAS